LRKTANEELGRLSLEDYRKAGKIPVVLVLDQVRSLHNVGSAFRTADAFRCAGICLCGITATPPNREIHKTALGAEESVDWKHFPDTSSALRELKQQGYTIVAIEQTSASVPLQQFEAPRDSKLALVFGHEIDGVSNEALALCDSAIEIPQHGTKHSLNVAVCVGVVLWEVAGRRI
jgi:tRNA G18 (ribose-2'-O)-methylase SpoU